MSVWNSVYKDRTGLPEIDISKIDPLLIKKISDEFERSQQEQRARPMITRCNCINCMVVD